jgi:subtilisin family serine protease
MRKLLAALLLVAGVQLTGWASENVVVELAPNARAADVAASVGGQVLDSVPGTSQYLMKVPSAAAMAHNPLLGVVHVELNNAVALPSGAWASILRTSGSKGAEWYAQQPAFKLVRADAALGLARGRGVVIADLNARLDYSHPALIGHLTGGYDFVVSRSGGSGSLNQSSASFLDQSSAAFLDQSSAAFLDQLNAAFLDQSTASFLDQSSASFLDQSNASFLDMTSPAHGHGTFCAGLLAAAAPDAMIMPLRVFDDSGRADIFSIVRAVHYAVEHGAHVINMSFGLTTDSSSVKQAVKFAIEHGVTVVASAGNHNTSAPQYPAGYKNVMSVASTDLTDKKASFSNYGSTIFVDAPGINIISAYPGGYYALASGTSFSAPLVSAEAALIRSARHNDTDEAVARGTVNIDSKNPGYAHELGFGRIDMLRALQTPDEN